MPDNYTEQEYTQPLNAVLFSLIVQIFPNYCIEIGSPRIFSFAQFLPPDEKCTAN